MTSYQAINELKELFSVGTSLSGDVGLFFGQAMPFIIGSVLWGVICLLLLKIPPLSTVIRIAREQANSESVVPEVFRLFPTIVIKWFSYFSIIVTSFSMLIDISGVTFFLNYEFEALLHLKFSAFVLLGTIIAALLGIIWLQAKYVNQTARLIRRL
jgi:hypothetical protein